MADILDADSEIERILSEYEKTLKFNSSLLLLNGFKLTNSSYRIECGLSPARNFLPAIIIRQNDDEMIFNTIEWAQLIEELQKLYSSFLTAEESEMSRPISIGDTTTINKVICGNEKQLKFMQRLNSFYLSAKDINELLKIDLALVSHRVEMLINLNFSYYYYNVLHSLKECFNYSSTSSPSLTIVEILNVFCESTDNSLLSNALREYLYFYKEDII